MKFQNFARINFLLNTWQWKVDPWKNTNNIFSPSYADYIVRITQADSLNIQIKSLPLLYTDKSGFFERRVYHLSCNETLWHFVRLREEKIYLCFKVNAGWNEITLLTDVTNTNGYAAFEYLAQIMPGVCLKHNLLTIHSALVECEGQAFAVCAPSGTGKTTHARLWRDRKNALILNGDRAVVGKAGAGWTAYGTPWSGTSGEQINRHAPLKALVVLERAPQNSVERLQGLSAFGSVLPHLLYPAWDKPLAVTAIDGLNDLLETVPVYRLRCRPDAGAVDVLCRALYEG